MKGEGLPVSSLFRVAILYPTSSSLLLSEEEVDFSLDKLPAANARQPFLDDLLFLLSLSLSLFLTSLSIIVDLDLLDLEFYYFRKYFISGQLAILYLLDRQRKYLSLLLSDEKSFRQNLGLLLQRLNLKPFYYIDSRLGLFLT